jgi:hypothetical protein
MELNLRFCLNIICILFVQSCVSPPPPPEKEYKNQLVIVIDKSNSVTYKNKTENIESELRRNFQEAYGKALDHIQLSRFTINGDTRTFPEPVRFDVPCPDPQPESRSEVEAFQNWQIQKAKWISSQIKQTLENIEQPPYASRTDVFSIFSGLEQVQYVDGPWDEVRVMIFSDMIHTVNGKNMRQGLTQDNAFEKGKEQCKALIDQGTIRKVSTSNLYITVYTPDNMPESSLFSAFWKGFFEEWGLPESQYHFQY